MVEDPEDIRLAFMKRYEEHRRIVYARDQKYPKLKKCALVPYDNRFVSLAAANRHKVISVRNFNEMRILNLGVETEQTAEKKWEDLSTSRMSKIMALMYKVCCYNWIPSINRTSLNPDHAILVSMVVNKTPCSFGKLAYDQIMAYVNLQPPYKLVMPNLMSRHFNAMCRHILGITHLMRLLSSLYRIPIDPTAPCLLSDLKEVSALINSIMTRLSGFVY
ncbi:unnamed protein product [Arabis nemorensis]|uniref:Uncharacterized protein n=1 Tax=Arabis nemorensis TaxID=586526 RepID=A0A565BTC8_9BRAS|nr:unnamed protein product [Arabis nemorensis]